MLSPEDVVNIDVPRGDIFPIGRIPPSSFPFDDAGNLVALCDDVQATEIAMGEAERPIALVYLKKLVVLNSLRVLPVVAIAQIAMKILNTCERSVKIMRRQSTIEHGPSRDIGHTSKRLRRYHSQLNDDALELLQDSFF